MANSLVLSSDQKVKDEFRSMIMKTLDAILTSIKDESAFSGIDPLVLREKVNKLEILPEEGLGFDKTLENVKDFLPHMLKTWSTDYMPHLHSPALLESIAAELIISVFNDSMDSWDQSPLPTEMEVAVLDRLAKLVGFENGDGNFTSGGSQSNISAIIASRDSFCKKELGYDVKKYGLPECYRKLKLYTSSISHFSMDKACHILGLGYEAVGKLPVDDKEKVDIKAFEKLLKEDVKKGFIPFCAVATLGTTDFGSIDDIGEMRRLCDKYHMHLHADAAYGSGLLMSDKYRYRLGDVSLCDSITIDFHKMFLLPISCSCVLVKDKSLLECFELHADYLNREEDEEDGYINLVGKSMQTTRRADAIKVYVSFVCRGKDGFGKIIDHSVENAKYLYDLLKDDKAFICPVEPEISSVVFATRTSDEVNKKIRRVLLSEGTVIGQTVKDGVTMLKFTLLNPALTTAHLDRLVDRIRKIRDSIC